MFRFLILEDDPDLIPQVRQILETEFVGARVSTATTSQEALELLNASLTACEPFNAAVIDCRIPTDSTSSAEIEYTVGEAFRDYSPDTGLVHFTAYINERSIPKELANRKLFPGNTRLFLLKQAGWPERLVHAVHRIIESPVERELEAFDRGRSTGRPLALDAHGRWFRSSDAVGTGEFSSLCEKVEKLWPGSTPEFRAKVREVLGAKEVKGQVHVGIAPDTTGAEDVTRELPSPTNPAHDTRDP